MAEGDFIKAEANYREAIRILPEHPSNLQEKNAYMKQWLKALKAGE